MVYRLASSCPPRIWPTTPGTSFGSSGWPQTAQTGRPRPGRGESGCLAAKPRAQKPTVTGLLGFHPRPALASIHRDHLRRGTSGEHPCRAPGIPCRPCRSPEVPAVTRHDAPLRGRQATGQPRLNSREWTHNPPVVGSSPTRPTLRDLERFAYCEPRRVGFQHSTDAGCTHAVMVPPSRPAGPALPYARRRPGAPRSGPDGWPVDPVIALGIAAWSI